VSLVIEPISDRIWLRKFVLEHWGEPGVVSRGRLTTPDELSGGFCARDGSEIVGCVTWRDDRQERELVTINALREHQGVGTALLKAVIDGAKPPSPKIWLVTTNDNVDALRFYQRRGWRISAVRPGALAQSRRLKPSIPAIGFYGIPLRDEIELEYAQ
jgi:ribosomal protein S18 acetylase RimI-like enzyme